MSRRVREIWERFGLPADVLEGLSAIEEQETVFVGTPEAMRFDDVRPMRRGIRLARIFPYSLKPTTFAMQVLGARATRNTVELDTETVKRLINGEDLKLELEAENGFILIKWQGFVVGVGHYKRPVLKTQIPRYRPVE